jgi:hypothetical protein
MDYASWGWHASEGNANHWFVLGGDNNPSENWAYPKSDTELGFFDNQSYGNHFAAANTSTYPIVIARGPSIRLGHTGADWTSFCIDIPLHVKIALRGTPIWAVFEPITHESDTNASGWSGSTPLYVQSYVKGGEVSGE